LPENFNFLDVVKKKVDMALSFSGHGGDGLMVEVIDTGGLFQP